MPESQRHDAGLAGLNMRAEHDVVLRKDRRDFLIVDPAIFNIGADRGESSAIIGRNLAIAEHGQRCRAAKLAGRDDSVNAQRKALVAHDPAEKEQSKRQLTV